MLEDARGHHFRRDLVAEQKNRQTVVAPPLRQQDLFQYLPARLLGFDAVYGHEPAGFVIGDIDEAPRIVVAEIRDDTESLLLDSGGQLTHAAPGGALSVIVFINDGHGECLQKVHGAPRTPATLC